MNLCVFLGGCYHATFYSETLKWRNYSARLKSNEKKMFQQNHIRRILLLLLHRFESFFMVKREKKRKKREISLSKYVRILYTHAHTFRRGMAEWAKFPLIRWLGTVPAIECHNKWIAEAEMAMEPIGFFKKKKKKTKNLETFLFRNIRDESRLWGATHVCVWVCLNLNLNSCFCYLIWTDVTTLITALLKSLEMFH